MPTPRSHTGEQHVRRFVARIRGHDDDVFVAPQSVEPEVFGRTVSDAEIDAFRGRHELGDGPLALYVGRLVPEKGVEVLLDAWPRVGADATLVLIGDGPLAARAARLDAARAAARAARARRLSRLPTPRPSRRRCHRSRPHRFREPWGLVCNEAMHQGRPMIATTAVGAVAGMGSVRDGDTGLVVAPGDEIALAAAIDRWLGDARLRARLGDAARHAVSAYTYDAMVQAFDPALEGARSAR